MVITGSEFYRRLALVCKRNGTSVSTFLESIGKQKSLGTSMQNAKVPNIEIAVAAAARFHVTAAWLLGVETAPIDGEGLLSLQEERLLEWFRDGDDRIRELILRIVDVIVNPQENEQGQEIFFGSKGDECHP